MSDSIPSKRSRLHGKREYLTLTVDRLKQFTGLDPSHGHAVSSACFTVPENSRVHIQASFKNRLLCVNFIVVRKPGGAVLPGACVYIPTNPSVHGGNKRGFYAALKEVGMLLISVI